MTALPDTMNAMVLTGHGGVEMYHYRTDCPVPKPAKGEVLIKVVACGLNNTDVNTRSGWYSKAVDQATTGGAYETVDESDPTWGGAPITFPRIQGADVCGTVVAVGDGVPEERIGERVITDNWLRDPDDPLNPNKTGYYGSERDGGFAQFTTIPSSNAISITSTMTDAELATFSCSYSTAEGMLMRASVTGSDTVLVTGASGGVGSALVQLAKLRGARVVALCSQAKHADVATLGADRVLPRAPEDLRKALDGDRITVVADIVGGDYWPKVIDILERGGRYVSSGAIAGPMVSLDLRTFYLRDLAFFGSTVIPPEVTKNLVSYIEAGKLKALVAATYPLEKLREAQTAFIEKRHTGNIVVTVD